MMKMKVSMGRVRIFVIGSVHRWDDIRVFHWKTKSFVERHKVELHAIADFNLSLAGTLYL